MFRSVHHQHLDLISLNPQVCQLCVTSVIIWWHPVTFVSVWCSGAFVCCKLNVTKPMRMWKAFIFNGCRICYAVIRLASDHCTGKISIAPFVLVFVLVSQDVMGTECCHNAASSHLSPLTVCVIIILWVRRWLNQASSPSSGSCVSTVDDTDTLKMTVIGCHLEIQSSFTFFAEYETKHFSLAKLLNQT